MTAIIKKTIFSTLAFWATVNPAFSQGEDLVGDWMSLEEPERMIRIYKGTDSFYYGTVNNPADENYGEVILTELSYSLENKVFKGKMTPPDKGITLDATLHFENQDKLVMEAKMLFVTRKMYLIRNQ